MLETWVQAPTSDLRTVAVAKITLLRINVLYSENVTKETQTRQQFYGLCPHDSNVKFIIEPILFVFAGIIKVSQRAMYSELFITIARQRTRCICNLFNN